MTTAVPPKGTGPLAKREARLAWGLLFPTIFSVAMVIILPLLSIFWISFKPVQLADLRPPVPVVRESVKGKPAAAGDTATIEYRLSNRSQDAVIEGVTLKDEWPVGVTITGEIPEACEQTGTTFYCDFGTIDPKFNERFQIDVEVGQEYFDWGGDPKDSEPVVTGKADFILTNAQFTLDNFKRVFDGSEFWSVFGVTLAYTVFGTIGAIVVGLFAALLLNHEFRGQGILRGLYLFPYVAPVIAVAFTWVTLFDPTSGSANELLIRMGVTEEGINFFGQKPLALIMVIVFEIWRYFPLSFLFILARLQAIDTDMYEAADMDGASPFQKFWYLSMPMLLGILSVVFLLRFIWTFNKFDDIFLLTGGNAGTRTLTVNVYEQAFAVSNIGAGAAVAVIVFGCLLVFSIFFFKFISREEGL
ncbi:carbohydrate ABC transporter permease [Aliiruegeria sabulilitoris]|uniref:carbohydrate ABC transporter permease n=1 Tax=Aliiruegeria sabulilitoris TaxID=1510458 RepID=UPI00082F1CDC|nr:sugar ABC transporter permease [Aliiruegeria sabulilitoris]NDR57277.1 sugar ABC transporter permease [Pseudoruegeria sp. M32A2M]